MQRIRENSGGYVEAEGGSALLGFLKLAWRRKSWLIVGTVAGLFGGALYYMRCPAVYGSAAQVLVIKKRPDVLPIIGVDTRLSPAEDYLSTHLTLIRSPLVIGRALRNGSMESLPSFARDPDRTRRIIDNLTVTRDTKDGGGSILNLSYRGGTPRDCETVLQSVIESYQDFLNETYRNVSEDTVRLIGQARDILLKELTQRESAHREFRQKEPLLWSSKEGTNLHLSRARDIELKLSALVLRRAEAQARLLALENALKENNSKSLEELIVQAPVQDSGRQLHEKLEPLLHEEKLLLEYYGPDHPAVRALRSKIELTRKLFEKKSAVTGSTARGEEDQLRETAHANVQALRRDLREAELSEQALKSLADTEATEAAKVEKLQEQDRSLRTEIARTQQLYESVIKRLQEVDLVKDLGGYQAKIISPVAGIGQVEPRAVSIFTVAIFLGLLASLGLVYLVEVFDQRVRDPDEVRQRLGLPVLAQIPLFPGQPKSTRLSGDLATAPSLVAYHQPQSAEAEAYRSLRTALYFSTCGEGHKVVQVTSPGISDGKTTLAANLAVSIAQSGKRVLLIDADLRHPQVHKLFGLPGRIGLASLLVGESSFEEAIQPSGLEGLSVLPCGPQPPNPADLLALPRFQDVLAEARKGYDFVVVDTPPLLAVSEPSIIARHVDGVILLLRLARYGWGEVERARELLNSLQAKILGVAINGIQEDASYHRYGYGYGDTSQKTQAAFKNQPSS